MSTSTHSTAALFVAPSDRPEMTDDELFAHVGPFTSGPIEATTAGYEVLLGEGVPVMRCTRCGAHMVLPESADPDLDVDLPSRMYHYNPCGKATR